MDNIALIRKTESIRLTDDVRPARLHILTMNDMSKNVTLAASGWSSVSVDRMSKQNSINFTFILILRIQISIYQQNSIGGMQLNSLGVIKLVAFRDGLRQCQCCFHDSCERNDSCQGGSGGPLQLVPGNSERMDVDIISFRSNDQVSYGTKLQSFHTRVVYYLRIFYWIESRVWLA